MKKSSLFLLAVLFLLHSCDGDDAVQPTTPALQIYGKVQHTNDSAIVGAKVSLLFSVAGEETGEIEDDILVCYPNPMQDELTISFVVHDQTKPVSLFILDLLVGERVATFYNSVQLAAGEYIARLSQETKNSIRNGRYTVRLVADGMTHEREILVNNENLVAFAVSDSSGRFFIDYDYIPIGFTFDMIDRERHYLGKGTVTADVTMIVQKENFPDKRVSLTIDKTKPLDVKMVMP